MDHVKSRRQLFCDLYMIFIAIEYMLVLSFVCKVVRWCNVVYFAT